MPRSDLDYHAPQISTLEWLPVKPGTTVSVFSGKQVAFKTPDGRGYLLAGSELRGFEYFPVEADHKDGEQEMSKEAVLILGKLDAEPE